MRAKKEKEFETIYSKYKDMVFGISVMYLKDYQLAEDATQETFIKALRKISGLKDKTKTKAWISKIAINVCRNKLVHCSRKEIPSDSLPQKADNGKFEEKLSVRDAISKLKPELREAVILFYYQDFTQAEISQMLKIPPTTVAYRIRTAKAKLKNLLKED